MALRGSGQEVGELPEIKCTYADCNKHFHTEKEMIRHKLSEPEHNYCKKCDVDCTSWDDLTQHKVSLMAGFWNDKVARESGASPKHITCEFCGEDFKSFGGRKKHRSQNHVADQSLYCPAPRERCGCLFTKASHLIQHLESGQCKFITEYDFRASVQQKYVRKEIFKNPDAFNENLKINKALAVNNGNPGLITDGSETQDQDDGGVSIMDQENEEQMRGYQPLRAERDIMDMIVPYTRENKETWPRMPGLAAPQLTANALRGLSIGSRSTSVTGAGSEYASDFTSRRGGLKVYTESYPSLNSPSVGASIAGYDDDTASEATTTASPTAWGTGQTSTALFPGARASAPPAGDWSAIVQQRENEIVANAPKNIMDTRFYDPASSDYHVELFFHSVLEKYRCPFPGCDAVYDIPSEIAEHLQTTHCKTSYNCTTCMKRFKSATALTAHMESSGRCKVKYSKNFHEVSQPYTSSRCAFR